MYVLNSLVFGVLVPSNKQLIFRMNKLVLPAVSSQCKKQQHTYRVGNYMTELLVATDVMACLSRVTLSEEEAALGLFWGPTVPLRESGGILLLRKIERLKIERL